jgi:hypothetical protein
MLATIGRILLVVGGAWFRWCCSLRCSSGS